MLESVTSVLDWMCVDLSLCSLHFCSQCKWLWPDIYFTESLFNMAAMKKAMKKVAAPVALAMKAMKKAMKATAMKAKAMKK